LVHFTSHTPKSLLSKRHELGPSCPSLSSLVSSLLVVSLGSLTQSESKSESYVMTDGQSAFLSWKKAPIWGLRLDFYYCQTVAGSWCGALSLTRGRVCRLQLLLALASAVILGSESRGTRDHILLSQIRDFPFRGLLRLAGLRWRYSTPPPYGACFQCGLPHARIEGLCFLCVVRAERIWENTGMGIGFTWIPKFQGNSSVARRRIRILSVWRYMCCSYSNLDPINRFANPNSRLSHWNTWQYTYFVLVGEASLEILFVFLFPKSG
jgi:hypothetical protein